MPDGKPRGRISQEKNLKTWLGQHVIALISDWFDCVEITTGDTEAGS